MNCRMLLFTLLLLPLATSALPIPQGTTPADDLIVNFDFTAASSLPPYIQVLAFGNFAAVNGPEIITVDLFGDLNGFGPVLETFDEYTNSAHRTYTNAAVSDGLFSLGFRSNSGLGQLLSSSATGTTEPRENATVAGTLVVPAQVPEPATLLLLFPALLWLTQAHRRQPCSRRTVRVVLQGMPRVRSARVEIRSRGEAEFLWNQRFDSSN